MPRGDSGLAAGEPRSVARRLRGSAPRPRRSRHLGLLGSNCSEVCAERRRIQLLSLFRIVAFLTTLLRRPATRAERSSARRAKPRVRASPALRAPRCAAQALGAELHVGATDLDEPPFGEFAFDQSSLARATPWPSRAAPIATCACHSRAPTSRCCARASIGRPAFSTQLAPFVTESSSIHGSSNNSASSDAGRVRPSTNVGETTGHHPRLGQLDLDQAFARRFRLAVAIKDFRVGLAMSEVGSGERGT